ncbi:DUF2892 domain-containing protein [Lutibaculum baratangense]|uniref:DUF2892 domain-containing protein n=1 Tax=Lutibaculum baratangense AMV1 TaxID=631454 RepID=V4RMW7_9HYPH|nr:DUF2892 domain-containing protein [Lutibaculum baratangense]ESR24565.1 hypothetical protein N177_2399 [Lutibaculum baratangense AMV1]
MRDGRVARHTAGSINHEIENETEASIHHQARHPHEIPRRLRELDEEWDVERVLEANAATLAFTGTVLGAVHDRRWLVLPAAVTAFLLQHAVQGWCPPLPVLRRMGIRTKREIEAERAALKALRGDFEAVAPRSADPRRAAAEAFRAVRH